MVLREILYQPISFISFLRKIYQKMRDFIFYLHILMKNIDTQSNPVQLINVRNCLQSCLNKRVNFNFYFLLFWEKITVLWFNFSTHRNARNGVHFALRLIKLRYRVPVNSIFHKTQLLPTAPSYLITRAETRGGREESVCPGHDNRRQRMYQMKI